MQELHGMHRGAVCGDGMHLQILQDASARDTRFFEIDSIYHPSISHPRYREENTSKIYLRIHPIAMFRWNEQLCCMTAFE
jgi:hypothetical protein